MPYLPHLKKFWKYTNCSKCEYGKKDNETCTRNIGNWFPYASKSTCGGGRPPVIHWKEIFSLIDKIFSEFEEYIKKFYKNYHYLDKKINTIEIERYHGEEPNKTAYVFITRYLKHCISNLDDWIKEQIYLYFQKKLKKL